MLYMYLYDVVATSQRNLRNMIRLKDLTILKSRQDLSLLPEGKLLINTINAHSYNTARKDALFAESLMHSDVLLPDGVSIVMACGWLRAKSRPKERIAGWDLFEYEMDRVNQKAVADRQSDEDNSDNTKAAPFSSTKKPKVMFMGSSEKVLGLIVKQAAAVYPNLEIVTYSPPYKKEFSEKDNKAIIKAVNDANPDLLWIGMTAPKQEKWAYTHWDELNVHCHVGAVGAVFDFFAGTVERAPRWWQKHGLEWLYRLLKEPRRMWRRYLIGNAMFIYNVAVHER